MHEREPPEPARRRRMNASETAPMHCIARTTDVNRRANSMGPVMLPQTARACRPAWGKLGLSCPAPRNPRSCHPGHVAPDGLERKSQRLGDPAPGDMAGQRPREGSHRGAVLADNCAPRARYQDRPAPVSEWRAKAVRRRSERSAAQRVEVDEPRAEDVVAAGIAQIEGAQKKLLRDLRRAEIGAFGAQKCGGGAHERDGEGGPGLPARAADGCGGPDLDPRRGQIDMCPPHRPAIDAALPVDGR